MCKAALREKFSFNSCLHYGFIEGFSFTLRTLTIGPGRWVGRLCAVYRGSEFAYWY
jgi:hypothetical protein